MKTVSDAQKDKDKALEQVLSDIEKQFGKGSIMKLGENAQMNIDVIPTGALKTPWVEMWSVCV